MPRISRPALVVLAVAAIILLHFIFSDPSDPHSSRRSKAAERKRGSSRDVRKPFDPSPPLSPSTPRSKSKGKGRSGSAVKGAIHEDGVSIDSRGLTSYGSAESLDGKHPIELLIERGRRLAKEQEAKLREVTSVDVAADEYERTFGLKPPKGFETWYKFTQTTPEPRTPNDPALFPFAHTPFDAYLAIPPDILRERVTDLRAKHDHFTLRFVPDGQGTEGTACGVDEDWYPEDWHERGKGRVIVDGGAAWMWRCNNTLSLILPILGHMPDEMFHMDPPLEIAFCVGDGPREMVHGSFLQRSTALGRKLKTWPKIQLHKAEQAMRWTWGWQWACPEGSPLKKSNADVVLNDLVGGTAPAAGAGLGLEAGTDQTVLSKPTARRSFIADFARAADFCYNPDLMTYHHLLLSDSSVGAGYLAPSVVTCRSTHNADVVGVPLDAVHEKVDVVPWEAKTLKKVFWRGSATGLHHSKKSQWRRSQRERLHWFSHNTSDATVSLLLDKGKKGGLVYEDWKVKDLNEAWLDVGLAGKPNQCSQSDGTCDEMAKEIDFMSMVRKEDATRFKFVIDVDGNGWSSRFKRLLGGNNVVLKSTLYPEWYSDTLIPWYHYVPLKLDYTDMYDILAFFMGAPDGSTPGRDDLAQEIAANGLRFSQERWRMEDMQSFTYLLILEFWRLMSDDRQAASFQV